MKTIKLIAFDLDDTLFLEREFVRSGFSAVANYLSGLGLVTAEEFLDTSWRLFEEGARGNIFNQAFNLLQCDFPSNRIPELVAVYRQHKPDIQPFAAAMRLLAALRSRSIITALISDGPEKTQGNKLVALGLADSFEHIIFTEGNGPLWRKPSLLPFLEVMERGKVAAADCVYVADNPVKDFLGPRRLGWGTVRVQEKLGIYYNQVPPAGGEPLQTVESFDNLFDVLVSRCSNE